MSKINISTSACVCVDVPYNSYLAQVLLHLILTGIISHAFYHWAANCNLIFKRIKPRKSDIDNIYRISIVGHIHRLRVDHFAVLVLFPNLLVLFVFRRRLALYLEHE